jgi:hypothetical protein
MGSFIELDFEIGRTYLEFGENQEVQRHTTLNWGCISALIFIVLFWAFIGMLVIGGWNYTMTALSDAFGFLGHLATVVSRGLLP